MGELPVDIVSFAAVVRDHCGKRAADDREISPQIVEPQQLQPEFD